MTNAEQTDYWYKYNRFTRSKANIFYPQVKAALNQQIDFFAKTRNIDLIPMQPIADVIKKIYVETGRLWAHQAYLSVRQQKARSPIGFNEEIIQRILQYFQTKLLNDAVAPITETTQDFIRDELSKGISEGKSIDEIVDEIVKSNITRVRAETIARTEIMKATSISEQFGIEKTGLQTMKIWISSRDGRTRRDHFTTDGQTVNDGEYFLVGPAKFRMQRPGDTSQIPNRKDAAKECINCRCVLGRKVLRGSNGLPLRA